MARPCPANSELPNYLIQIDLMGVSDPNISRTLSVPPLTAFHTLHCAIQVAFGWKNSHLHHFDVLDAPPTTNSSRPYQHRMFRPPVPVLLGLEPDPKYEDYDGTIPEDSKQWRLCDVFENDEYKNKQIEYLYDFGDNWEHSITLIGRARTSTSSIVCLSGEGGHAAEDCGGAFGWQELKQLYAEHGHEKEATCTDPSAHETLRWYENGCLNGQKWGLTPEVWDKEAINKEFAATDGLMHRIARAEG